MANVGTLFVDIGVNDSGFKKTLAGMEASLQSAGQKMQSVGKTMSVAFTAPLAAVAGVSSKVFGDIEGGLREVNSLFGLTGKAAEDNFGDLKNIATEASAEVGILQSDVVPGLYNAISAGVPKDNALDFIKVAGKAAIAGVTDLNTSVDGLTTVINAFGKDFSEAGVVADSMFAAVQGGKTTFEELSASLFNVAPAAAASKVSMQEVNAAIATLTASGTPTSVATTQIRAALTGLQKPSKDLDAVFQKLGFQNAQLAIESEGLGFALEAVKNASQGNNGELQKLLGSVEAVAAANVLAGTGAEKFNAELDRQANSLGAANGAFEEIDKSFNRQIEKTGVLIESAGQSIGEILAPAIIKLNGIIQGAIKWFTDLSSTSKTIIVAFGGILAIAGPLIAGIGFFATTVLPALKAGLIASKVAMMALNGTLLANPIGVVITAAVALSAAIALLWKNSETFRGTIKGVWEALKVLGNNIVNGFTSIPELIIEAFKEVPKAFLNLFKGVGDIIKAVLTGDFKAIPELLKDAGKNLIKTNPLLGAGAKIGKQFSSGMSEAFGKAFDAEVKEETQNATTDIAKVIKPEAKKTGDTIGDTIATGVVEGFKKADVPQKMRSLLEPSGPIFSKQIADSLKDVVSSQLGTSKGPKVAAPQARAVQSFSQMGGEKGGGMSGMFDRIAGGFTNFFNGPFAEKAGAVLGAVFGSDIVTGIFDDLVGGSEAFAKIMEIINQFVGKIVGSLQPIFDTLMTMIEPIIMLLGQFASALVGAISSLLTSLLEPLTVVFEALGLVIEALFPLIDVIANILTPVFSLVGVILKNVLAPVLKLVASVLNVLLPILELVTIAFIILMPIIMLVSELFKLLELILRPTILIFSTLGEWIQKVIDKIKSVLGKDSDSGGSSSAFKTELPSGVPQVGVPQGVSAVSPTATSAAIGSSTISDKPLEVKIMGELKGKGSDLIAVIKRAEAERGFST